MAIETIALVAGIVLILPWTFKHIGDWNKVKKWYSYLLGGGLIGLISTVLGLYAESTGIFLVGVSGYYLVQLLTQTIALVLVIVGLIGMSKNLIWK